MKAADSREPLGIDNVPRPMRWAPLILSLPLALAACKSKPPRVLESPEGEPPPSLLTTTFDYRVGVGDVLRVNVFGHPELSSAIFEEGAPGTPVNASGNIMLPLIESVAVEGHTVEEVTELVRGELARYLREPRVDTAVVRFGAHRVFVLGEVNEPGSYVLERPTTVMEALSFAGGLDTFAHRTQVAWVHGPLSEENMVLFDAGALDPVAARTVDPGDVIFVGRRRWSNQAEAARELLPFLAFITQPLSLAIQAATLNKID